MLTTLLGILVATHAPGHFTPKQMAYQPLNRLTALVGPKVRLGHVPGIFLQCPGFDKVYVDADGPKMSRMEIRPLWLGNWKSAAARLGIDTSHATAHPLRDPSSPIPQVRNSVEIVGAQGLPMNPATHRPWKLIYREEAVANKARLRALKPQINAASVPDRVRLIRTCYDWYSTLDLSAS